MLIVALDHLRNSSQGGEIDPGDWEAIKPSNDEGVPLDQLAETGEDSGREVRAGRKAVGGAEGEEFSSTCTREIHVNERGGCINGLFRTDPPSRHPIDRFTRRGAPVRERRARILPL